MATILSIDRVYKKHHEENPESSLSKSYIRLAAKRGDFPIIKSGSKTLICYETFEAWLSRSGECLSMVLK